MLGPQSLLMRQTRGSCQSELLLASLGPGPGLYLFAAMVLLWTLASTSLDFQALAEELDSREAA